MDTSPQLQHIFHNMAQSDPTSLPTPSSCTADFCIIPIGTPTASVSKEVAAVQRLLKRSGVKYSMHSAGTTLGRWQSLRFSPHVIRKPLLIQISHLAFTYMYVFSSLTSHDQRVHGIKSCTSSAKPTACSTPMASCGSKATSVWARERTRSKATKTKSRL